ncbi:Uncharacterised conserved protein UCP029215 [uncultured Caudovirales phage]|uniref:Uncharacterized conserved protein UCP029215 n=1 Tax=uncultured Caudovirales phage TaxID=2100421 RepID=A0A6J5NRQ5_9CAUD|nr:Uncharacterised conserved protein UCP029215 [uncultured Caudovirales phage]
MNRKRVNLLSAVNAKNVSRSADGATYTVRDVVHAVDGIVLNGRLYAGPELAKSVDTLNGKPAPAGHPKDSKGRHITASHGEALASNWVGAYCTNSRYEGGRAMCDLTINAAQAKAMPAGAEVLQRLDAAIAGTNTEPIAVSSGLMLREVAENGESRGKKYRARAVDMNFDHVAILLNEAPAGTPEEGVGMFVNEAGQEEAVEVVTVNTEPEDRRHEGLERLKGWVMKLLGNSDELSFDQIREGLYKGLPEGSWVREVFARYAIWTDRDGKHWRQDYAVSSDGSVAFSGTAQEVREKREYEPVTNLKKDAMKDMLIAALNSAGISTEGLSDAQLLAAYNAHVKAAAEAPLKTELAAANAKLQTFEANAQAAEATELATLATELAANSAGTLTAEDFKVMGLKRCRELRGNGKAAPVVPGGTAAGGTTKRERYSLNADLTKTA